MRRAALLALLALAAGAAAACKGAKQPPVATFATVGDSADQVMFNARSILTDEGLLRAELHADTAFFYDDNSRIEMRQVQVTFYKENGAKSATLTSREGTYLTRAGNMEARGNVVVVSEDGRRLETPQLRYDQQRDQISSDSAFVLTEPGRRLTGIGFVSDPNMTNVRILKTTGGTTGGVTIPGQ